MGNKKILGLFKGILAILLVSILLIQPLSMRVFAVGNNDIPTGNESFVSNMKVEVLIDGHWANHYNVRIKLTNTGSDTIHSWSLGTKTEDKIEGLYNAIEISDSLGKDDESIKIFNHTSYNQDIYPGDSVEFGYTAVYSGSFDVPNEFIDASCLAQVENKNFKVKKEVISNWNSGGIGNITVYNYSDKAIEDWTVEFDSKCEIKEVWNGKLISNNNGHYVITNPGYNQNIDRHSQITIGVLYGKNVYSSINNTALSCMSINDISVLFPDYEKDTDEDGLPDFYEDEIGTDKNKVDTDGDGLSDYEEEFDTLTDPLIYDSVIDGVPDSDVDLDEDGFTNKYELEIGTDPYFEDTDFDGLRDDEEINTYKTNPVKRDTDEDGITDGDEILLGLNPLKNDSDDDGINDSEEVITQKVDKENFEEEIFDNNVAIPSLSVNAKGNINKRIKIEYVPTYLIGDERAIIGKGIDIINSPSEGGKLTFTLPSDYKFEKYVLDGKETEGLLIEYYNQEEVIPLKTTVDTINKTISADIVGDGWYYILYMPGYLNIFGYEMPSDDNCVLNESGYYVEVEPYLEEDSVNTVVEEFEEESEAEELVEEELDEELKDVSEIEKSAEEELEEELEEESEKEEFADEELENSDSDNTDRDELIEDDEEDDSQKSGINNEEEISSDDSDETNILDYVEENQDAGDTSLNATDEKEEQKEDIPDDESIEIEDNKEVIDISEYEDDSVSPVGDEEKLDTFEESVTTDFFSEDVSSRVSLSGMSYFKNIKDIGLTNLKNGEGDVKLIGVDNPSEPSGTEVNSGEKKTGNPNTKDINAVVDIVFVFDTTGSMSSAADNTQQNLGRFTDYLAREGITVSYGLVDYKDIEPENGNDKSRIITNGYSNWFHSSKDIKSAVRSLNIYGGGDGPECALDGLALAETIGFRSNAQKYIILVTDANNKNTNDYGKSSLEEIANEFARNDICVSVIAPNYSSDCHADYDVLCEKTGGIYVDIYGGNYLTELLKIADKIKDYSKGYWVALDTPVPTIVRLEEKPQNGSLVDTDKDELLDCEELIVKENNYNFIGFNSQLELMYGGNTYFDYKQLQVYPFKTNPATYDSDFDGMSDKWDSEPLNYEVAMIIYETKKTDKMLKEISDVNRTGYGRLGFDKDDYSLQIKNNYNINDDTYIYIDDYQYSNLSESDITSMNHINSKFYNKTQDVHEKNMSDLLKLGSMNKKMKSNITEMVTHFLDGTGYDYKNNDLTEAVKNHDSSIRYTQEVSEVIEEYLRINEDDFSKLVYHSGENRESDNELLSGIKDEKGNIIKKGMCEDNNDGTWKTLIYPPSFNSYNDYFNSGLGISMHSLYGNRIELTSVDTKEKKYTLRYTYYDIFGLDYDDIEDNVKHKIDLGDRKGFKSWYVLQHSADYTNKPFLSYVVFEESYSYE